MAPRPKLTPLQKQDVGARYKAGATCSQLAEVFGVSPATIRAALIDLGIERNVHFRNLSAEEVVEVRRRHDAGESSYKIAASLGVSRPAISSWIKTLKAAEAGEPSRRSRREASSRYTCNHSFFDAIDTEEKAYILGFIAADGCINDGYESPELTIVLKGSDAPHLFRIAETMGMTRPVRTYNQKGYEIARLALRSEQIISSLATHGVVPRKTFSFGWPSLDYPMYRHFLRGFIDGDGCWFLGPLRGVQKTRQLSFSLIGNEKIIPLVVGYLKSTVDAPTPRLSPRYKKNGNLSTLTFRYDGNAMCHRLANLLYEDATIYLPRKREIVLRHYQSLPKYRDQLRFG